MRILEILGQDKETLEKKKTERLAKALKRKQEALIDSLEEKRDELICKKEKLLTITVDTVNTDNWNKDYQDCQVEVLMLDKRLEIAKNTLTDMFTEIKVEA